MHFLRVSLKHHIMCTFLSIIFHVFFPSPGEAAKVFQRAATDLFMKLDYARIYQIISSDVASDDEIYLSKIIDGDTPVRYNGSLTSLSDLKSFLERESVPLLTPFSKETSQVLFQKHVQAQVWALLDQNMASFSSDIDLLVDAAKKFKVGSY